MKYKGNQKNTRVEYVTKRGKKVVKRKNKGFSGQQELELQKQLSNERVEHQRERTKQYQANKVAEAAKGIGQGLAYNTAGPATAATASYTSRMNSLVGSYSDQGKDDQDNDTDNSGTGSSFSTPGYNR